MQTITYWFQKLLSPVCKRSVSVKQTNILKSISSVPRVCCHNPCWDRIYSVKVSSCQRWHHVSSHSMETKRSYSEICGENNAERNAGLIQEESPEVYSINNQRSSQTFSPDVLVSLLRQENAVDICVIKVPEQIKYAEYFIVVSGTSPRHLQAMAQYAMKVYKFLKKDGEPYVKIEGRNTDDWMCIDFGSIVVHFMLPETREVYELEKLWTLRTYDEQLKNIPAETIPEDFIYDLEDTK